MNRTLKSRLFLVVLILISTLILPGQQSRFTLESIMSYPFPGGLTASATGSRIAWEVNLKGKRNLFVAEGPEFEARQITNYNADNGQSLSAISLSPDGSRVVYIRGGDFGSNWSDELPVNAISSTQPPKVGIWSIPFEGGEPVMLGEGLNPLITPGGERVVFTDGGQIWSAPIDGSEKPLKLFTLRGNNADAAWSPDGQCMAFTSSRGDHSFIGIYSGADKPIKWVDPGFSRDGSPVWSRDGKRIAFIRQPGSGGEPASALKSNIRLWKIMVYDIESGDCNLIYESPATLMGSVPPTQGGINLNWGSGRVTFLSYHDGWPHLFSIGPEGGELLLLTPGDFMAEYISLSPDGKSLLFSGNTGPDKNDIDRRHIVMASTVNQEMRVITSGTGNEWTPFITGDGKYIAFIGAEPRMPPVVKVKELNTGIIKEAGRNLIPADFPLTSLVVPYQVIFRAPDGTSIHGQVFNDDGINGKKPAVIFVHGGPPRQMLLGWHYSSYYSNAYAVNQYLASIGFVVVSVNYRLGIGYGYDFHRPEDGGARGASEYQDVLAAHEWLTTLDIVDPSRIGIYGGSYGGYLTAMALARNSDLFAAGVDISGVHDWTSRGRSPLNERNRYEQTPDAEDALRLAWESSPVSAIDGWKSPGLIIHADDDRNVDYNQSTDLVQRLTKLNAPFETLSIVDDTHHFMLFRNQLIVNEATAGFLIRKLMK
ncbi:MAG TPA: alpha/beta fold hydrolase [Bacteroidales bacterium]|nr:alpha/beta fold hydrolase [Bacteroidales bacterium]